MLFGDILRTLLEDRNLTQKQFANDLNIAASTIGNYIRNLRQPDFDTIRKIANYFNVSTDYLLNHSYNSTLNKAEMDLLRIFRELDSEQKEIFINQGKAFLTKK